MEGQYGKGDPLSFDVYRTCPQLKAPFTKYCKVFEHRLAFRCTISRASQDAVPRPPSRITGAGVFTAIAGGIAKLKDAPAPRDQIVVGLRCRMVGANAAG